MNDKELAENLEIWFNNNQNRQNKWNDNLTGAKIKERIWQIGNWRNLPRGNPAKGKREQEKTFARRAGYEVRDEENY